MTKEAIQKLFAKAQKRGFIDLDMIQSDDPETRARVEEAVNVRIETGRVDHFAELGA